jgi:hypothetical protein
VRRLLLLAALGLAAVGWTAAAPAGAATNECRGLQVCVPVVGPWVVVPVKQSVPRPEVQFQLSCPKGYIVGGTDAELTSSAIDLTFFGSLGAPVNPGITTARDVVFTARYVGTAKGLPTFRPHLGCMPASGGGSRTPTAVVVPPGKPVVRHVKNVTLHPGRQRAVVSCAASERLVDVQSALAFDAQTPPLQLLPQGVTIARSVKGDSVTARLTTVMIPPGAKGIVQLMAVCAGGK